MISQLLKLASEDKECEGKLAFVYDAMENKDVGQDISDEIEFLLGEVEESLEKNAGIFDTIKGGISSAGKAAKPYAGAAALGAASLVGSALVSDMYSAARVALSRNRNYKIMLEADPELKQHPAEKVKALFNTLHEKGGPEMSGDPFSPQQFFLCRFYRGEKQVRMCLDTFPFLEKVSTGHTLFQRNTVSNSLDIKILWGCPAIRTIIILGRVVIIISYIWRLFFWSSCIYQTA